MPSRTNNSPPRSCVGYAVNSSRILPHLFFQQLYHPGREAVAGAGSPDYGLQFGEVRSIRSPFFSARKDGPQLPFGPCDVQVGVIARTRGPG